MGPSISWTEPSVLRTLVEEAARPNHVASNVASRPVPSATPLASSATPLASSARPLAHAAHAVAPVVPPPPPRTPTPFESVAGSIDEGVEHLIDWLASTQMLDGLFVTDAHGLAIANRGVDTEHVAICATLMQTLADVRSSLATDTRRMAIAVNDAQVLHLVAVETSWGSFGVGMLSATFLSDDFMAEAQRALSLTLGGKHDDE